MSAESIAEIREWANGDRVADIPEQAAAIRWITAVAGDTAGGEAKAQKLEAAAALLAETADGLDKIADEAEALESGAIEDPGA